LIIKSVDLQQQSGEDRDEFVKKAILYCLENNVDVTFYVNKRHYLMTPTSIIYTIIATQRVPKDQEEK
jgi:hypothetical protein